MPDATAVPGPVSGGAGEDPMHPAPSSSTASTTSAGRIRVLIGQGDCGVSDIGELQTIMGREKKKESPLYSNGSGTPADSTGSETPQIHSHHTNRTTIPDVAAFGARWPPGSWRTPTSPLRRAGPVWPAEGSRVFKNYPSAAAVVVPISKHRPVLLRCPSFHHRQ